MAIRTCCDPDCTAEVSKPHILCIHHWGSLPGHVKRDIQIRLRARRDEPSAREFYRLFIVRKRSTSAA
jgi:hypothetical protein